MKALTADEFLRRNEPTQHDAVTAWPLTVDAAPSYHCGSLIFIRIDDLKKWCAKRAAPEGNCLCRKLNLRESAASPVLTAVPAQITFINLSTAKNRTLWNLEHSLGSRD